MAATEEKRRPPAEMIAEIRRVGELCVLAGCTADECIDATDAVARKYGFTYRPTK